MRQVEATLGRTFSNMTDDTAECLLQLPKTRAYLAGQEHRAHNLWAEVEFNMLPEWPRIVCVFCEMLALMADVRMGFIRVPPEMQYRDHDNHFRFAWPWQMYDCEYLLRDVLVEGGPPHYHTLVPNRRRGMAFDNSGRPTPVVLSLIHI